LDFDGGGSLMGIRIEVDEALLAEAQDVSGQATKRKNRRAGAPIDDQAAATSGS
jgi:hypothetical protein